MEFYFLPVLFTIFTVARCQDVFTIVPTTQYVWVNRTATFECATNDSRYNLVFDIPNITEDLVTEILPEGGQKLVATFTATIDVNGSSVKCGALEGFTLVVMTDPVYVYIQDNIPSVNSFVSEQQECAIVSSWKLQHLLPGLSVSYKVFINGEIAQESISTTSYTYYPMKLASATYELAVSAFNDSVVGDASITTASFTIGSSVTYNQGATRRLDNDTWFYQLEIPGSIICSCNITEIQLQCCYSSDGTSICYNASMTNNEVMSCPLEERYFIEGYVDIPVSTILQTSATIEYATKQIYTTNEVITSSFNLQSMELLNVTNQQLCLRLQLVNGTSTHTVFLHAVNDVTTDNHILGEATTTAQQLSYDVCYSILPGTWTVYACDGPAPSNINTCTSPATSLPAVIITSIRTSTTIIVQPTTSRDRPSTTSSNTQERTTSSTYSTRLNVMPTVGRITDTNVGPIIAVVVVLVVLAIVIVIVAVITVLLYRKKRSGTLSFNFKHSTSGNLDSPRSTVQVTLVPAEEHCYEITSTDGTINSMDGTINSDHSTFKPATSPGKPLVYADIGEFIGKNDVTPEPPTQYAEIAGTIYKPFPVTLSHKTQDVAPTQTELQDILVPRLSRLWFSIGMELGLNPDQLEEVEGNRADDDGCFKDVLMMWEVNATVNKPYTWTTMLNVLRSTKIGEGKLANLLSARFKPHY